MRNRRHHTGDLEPGAARRAWLSGLLVWTLVLQLLVPMLGPLRLGDGTAVASLGRLVPICTIEGLRLAEPGTAGDMGGRPAVADTGWHCALCAAPALPAVERAGTIARAALHIAWAAPPPVPPPTGRARSPFSARGPPTLS